MSEALIWARTQKNIIYMIAGVVIGAAVMTDLKLSRVDVILLIVAFGFMIWEFILHMIFITKDLKKSLKERKNAKAKEGERK